MKFSWQVLEIGNFALVYIQSKVTRIRPRYLAPCPFRIVDKVNAFFSNIISNTKFRQGEK